jgi:hypothetical protein
VDRLKEKIAKLNEEVARLNRINKDLHRSDDEQYGATIRMGTASIKVRTR